MLSRVWPQGIRGRLVAAIVLVVAGVLAVTFVVLHDRTGSDLESRIDDQLASDLHEFQTSPAAEATSATELHKEARHFVDGQAYHPDSRIFAIEIGTGPGVVTNSEELIEVELGETGDDSNEGDEGTRATPSGLLSAPAGFATVSAGGDARVRVLSAPIESNGGQIGTFHVAESLRQVATAQDSLRATLLLVGAIALVLLVGAAVWIATLVARPLDRMARFAIDVDSAELDSRLDLDGGPAEVRSLTRSLNHMLDRLQRAFEREREFVADASHELRTPITVAEGELDLLRRELDGAQGERVDVIRRELRRMEALISEMLTLAKEDSGRSLERREVAVDDLLDDLRRDLPLLGPREYYVDAVPGTIAADPDRVAQVLRNLARNAVTHTIEGGRINVHAQPDGNRLRVLIEDDGPGIEAQEADRLFERFYRGDDGRARDRTGSGLGLAIAKAIVDAHGGRIWAEPTTGRGGRVAFELPHYRPPAAERA